MKMVCCGVVYSTNDPETFWCIEIYGVNPVSKEIAYGKRVEKERSQSAYNSDKTIERCSLCAYLLF